ncbi:MAG: DUF2937 family protein [Alphaproteobacteria bacterium]|nr:DUF2937 family protein [Alphaproteobacteria bacterium]
MIRDVLLGAMACIWAALFSQVPAFLQQYLQRLGGHLDEARRLREQAPHLLTRIDELRMAHDSLLMAEPLARPFVAVRHLQKDIALRALEFFQPALPLTLEGLMYAGAGMVFAVLVFNLLSLPFRGKGRARQA